LLRAILQYDNGTIVIKGINHVPFATFDPRTRSLRARALYYTDIIEYMRSSDIECEDQVLDLIPSPHLEAKGVELRDYQQKALNMWI